MLLVMRKKRAKQRHNQWLAKERKTRQKHSSFQDEIIALQREHLAAQTQQVQHKREFFRQVLDAQNQMEEKERGKGRTFLLELGKLFANKK